MADTAAVPSPEQLLIGLALLVDSEPDVADVLSRIAGYADSADWARLLGQPTDAYRDAQLRAALDLLDRIAPHYTAHLREALA